MLAFLETKILSVSDSLQQRLLIDCKILGTALKHQGKFIIKHARKITIPLITKKKDTVVFKYLVDL